MLSKLSLITESTPARVSFAEAMSTLASGVVVVTSRRDGRPWGSTVTAFASVSADPPTVLVSLCTNGSAGRAIAATRQFGVSILAEEQLAVALYASAPGKPKFLEAFAEPDASSATPVVAGALAHLDCDVVETVDVADHTIFFGRVRAASATDAGAPLVYHRRRYRALAADPATERSTTCLMS